jgi:KDO2-lipid IV(A) lauroyltransferase
MRKIESIRARERASRGHGPGRGSPPVRVPRARAPWLTRLLFRFLDLLILPALHVVRAVLACVKRERALETARRLARVIAWSTDLATFRRNFRAIRGRDAEPLAPGVEAELVERAAAHQLQHIVDIVKVVDLRAAPLDALVEPVGQEHMDAALARGRGVILVSSHLGSWELAAAWIGSRGWPLNVLYYEQLSRVLDRYLNGLREAHGCRMLHQRRGLKEALRALDRGEILGVVADQDGTRSGLFVEFFGVLVSVPRGPVRLALSRGCPIVETWNQRLPDGRYRQVFGPPILPPGAGDGDGGAGRRGEAAERELARRVLAGFESVIRSDPTQWLLSYDRFKLRHLPRLEELGLAERAFADQIWLQGRPGEAGPAVGAASGRGLW